MKGSSICYGLEIISQFRMKLDNAARCCKDLEFCWQKSVEVLASWVSRFKLESVDASRRRRVCESHSQSPRWRSPRRETQARESWLGKADGSG